MLVDTCIILVLIGWIFFFKVYSGLISTHAKQERVCASMYAVEVHGLPIYREEGAPNETEIKEHFSKFGEVHSVCLIRDTGDLYDIYS